MKRIGIFCLYTSTGEVDSSIQYTLSRLKEVVEYLIVVVNGCINNENELSAYADVIVKRHNRGFDVGAFKEIILSSQYIDKVKESDELVLCNSSFYGPFITFQDIFKKMSTSNADFWGISSSEKNLSQHIQSYFLVFCSRILKGEEFYSYLRDRVDIDKIDYDSACSVFENGLFWTLKKAGYQYDAYKRDIDCDNYRNPYGSVKIDGIPVLKKKIFSKEFYQEKRVVNALSYIRDAYSYDIEPILKSAYQNYGIDLKLEMIRTYPEEIAEKDLLRDAEAVEREEIERFIEEQKRVFIYGNGVMARIVYSSFFFYENNPRLAGFVVSDDQPVWECSFRGYPIYRFAEVKDRMDAAFLVGLNKSNTKEVFSKLNEAANVMFIWR